MSSDERPNGDQNADPSSPTLIPVDVDHVDQLVLIARDLAGFVLFLDAAAIGDPAFAAVERILSEINGWLQEFKNWFHDALECCNSRNRIFGYQMTLNVQTREREALRDSSLTFDEEVIVFRRGVHRNGTPSPNGLDFSRIYCGIQDGRFHAFSFC